MGCSALADGLVAAQGPGRRAGRTNGPSQGRRPQDVAGPAAAGARPTPGSGGHDAVPEPVDPGADSHGRRRQAPASRSGKHSGGLSHPKRRIRPVAQGQGDEHQIEPGAGKGQTLGSSLHIAGLTQLFQVPVSCSGGSWLADQVGSGGSVKAPPTPLDPVDLALRVRRGLHSNPACSRAVVAPGGMVIVQPPPASSDLGRVVRWTSWPP